MPAPSPRRCHWPKNDLAIRYYDEEWGVPVHDDRKLFEFMILDAFQAGLSWDTILKKRDNFRAAFDNFDAGQIARYDKRKMQRLLHDAGIIRDRLKIKAAIGNADASLAVQKEFGSFGACIWQSVGGKTRVNHRRTHDDVPARTRGSDAMSKDLKRRGFKFVGSTICYAFMQAAAMVNAHAVDCFRRVIVGDL